MNQSSDIYHLICLLMGFLALTATNAQNLCYTPENIAGDCRSIYDCPNVLAQFRGRLTQRTTTYLRSLQCAGGFGQYPHVCCVSYFDFEQQPRPTRPRPYNNRPASTWLQSANSGSGNEIPGTDSCGLSSLAHRIFGGDETQLDDYPWMAILEYQPRRKSAGTRRERKLSCGGSLINSRYVLSAAHCLVGEIETRVGELVGVRLGEYDITKEIDCLGNNCADPVLYMGVEEKIPHEGYNQKNKNRANDIGLIRLNGEVTYTDYIRPICLPASVNSRRAHVNEKLVSAGWGRTLTTQKSATKQEIRLPLVDHAACASKYGVLGIHVSDNQLCAGGNYGEDTCDGDSGNALMRFVGNAWIVEGIVSFGRGCGLADWPAVYTKVSNYDNWIRSKMRS